MTPRRAPRTASTEHGPALLAAAALLALLIGCDPIVRPGDNKASTGDQQSGGGGEIYDNTGGGPDPVNCGGGPYVFSISASDVDPWVDTGEIDANGATTLWLWKADGGGLGAVAGDFSIQASSDPSTFVAFAAVAPNLNIDKEGLQQVFLAVAGCEPGPQLLGKLTVYGRPDLLRVRLASILPKSVAVDCCGSKPGWGISCGWFEAVPAPPDTTASDTTRVGA